MRIEGIFGQRGASQRWRSHFGSQPPPPVAVALPLPGNWAAMPPDNSGGVAAPNRHPFPRLLGHAGGVEHQLLGFASALVRQSGGEARPSASRPADEHGLA